MHEAAGAVTTTAAAATRARPPIVRVAGVTIKDTTFKTMVSVDHHVPVLWRVLDHCVVPAEERAHAHFDRENIPTALRTINVRFPFRPRPNASIIDPLTTHYPALVRSLQVLTIRKNNHDESVALGAFAALATHLRELTFRCCGLTSVRGLEGHCENLRQVDLWGCEHLSSLDADLGHHLFLEEINASNTPITTVEPLRVCPALTKVYIHGCRQLSSIEALEGFQQLQEVDASHTAITTIRPLRKCLVLTKVSFSWCQQLASIEALGSHERLQVFDAPGSAITSVEPLRTCPALTEVDLCGCRQLASLGGLDGHQYLQIVNTAHTSITSVEPLRTCPALTHVYLGRCEQLASIEALAGHEWLQVVFAGRTPISSIDPLRSCPALTKVDLSDCQQLPANVDLPVRTTVIR